MARIAQFVVPGLPHHVTQRGNRREAVFFGDDAYRALPGADLRRGPPRAPRRGDLEAYCLMPNHVHFIIVPDRAHALGRALAEAYRRYSADDQCLRERVLGHLWQARFGSTAMDGAAPDGGGALPGDESGAGAACRMGGRLPLVQRAGPSAGRDDGVAPSRRPSRVARAASPTSSRRRRRPRRCRCCGLAEDDRAATRLRGVPQPSRPEPQAVIDSSETAWRKAERTRARFNCHANAWICSRAKRTPPLRRSRRGELIGGGRLGSAGFWRRRSRPVSGVCSPRGSAGASRETRALLDQ